MNVCTPSHAESIERDLVDHELQEEQCTGQGDHPPLLHERRCVDPTQTSGDTHERHDAVDADAGRPSGPHRRAEVHVDGLAQDRRWVGVGDEVELLHGSGHRHIEQAGAAFGDRSGPCPRSGSRAGSRRSRRRTRDPSPPPDRTAGAPTRRVRGRGRRPRVRPQPAPQPDRLVQRHRRDHRADPPTVLRRHGQVGHGGGQRHATSTRSQVGGSPVRRTLRLSVASTPVKRQQPVGDDEDRLGHAIADRQIGDRALRAESRTVR